MSIRASRGSGGGPPCTFPGCYKARNSHGLCTSHLWQWNQGKELTPQRVYGLTVEERLDSLRTSAKISEDGCWISMRKGHPRTGYVQIALGDGRTRLLHLLAHERWIGPIPSGLTVHHKCANGSCFNPDHLELATQAQNVGEMMARRSYEARILSLEHRIVVLEAENAILLGLVEEAAEAMA